MLSANIREKEKYNSFKTSLNMLFLIGLLEVGSKFWEHKNKTSPLQTLSITKIMSQMIFNVRTVLNGEMACTIALRQDSKPQWPDTKTSVYHEAGPS